MKIAELFCGAGGIGLGAKLAGLETLWATDYDKDACETYAYNLKPKHPMIVKDIRQVDFKKLLRDYGAVEGLTFGFPCNDFSLAGSRLGLDGQFGGLYKECVRALSIIKPIFFVAENVTGIKSNSDGKAFKSICNELKEQGYNLYPHCYKFEQYGVPQRRHRIIIIGIREDVEVNYKIPSTERYTNVDISCKNALNNVDKCKNNNEIPKQSRIVEERLSYIEPGSNLKGSNLPEHLKLKHGKNSFSDIYRRLHPDKPSTTITAKGGGGTCGYHFSEHRSLTNRERARIQTFPDDYIFKGSKQSIRSQIGMAVSPKVAEIIFKSILDTFKGLDYNGIDCNIDIGKL